MADLDEYGVALRVASVFDELRIEYTLGGSLASSLHGEPRSTNDIDFAVRIEIGLVAGVAAALGAGRFIEAELYGVNPRDPLTLSAVVLLIGIVGLVASVWPTWKASRVDPASALRND